VSSFTLVAIACAYAGVLFLVANAVDRSSESIRTWLRRPLVHTLALGVFATSWTFFGAVGSAAAGGYRFIAVHIGPTISCALYPLIWARVSRLCEVRKIASLADLFEYRYRSRAVGALVAIFLLAGSLPYQALQLSAAVEAVATFAGTEARGTIGIGATFLLVAFTLAYGVRHVTPLARHDGFVTVLALESVVKLIAIVAIGAFALFSIFGGVQGLDRFLAEHPEARTAMTAPVRSNSWLADLLLPGAAIFLLPRQWHIAFNEGSPQGLRTASWALPCYLLLLTLPVPVLFWAARALGLSGSPDFYVLGICRASGSVALSVVVFVGVLAASSSMIVATTVALVPVLQNQLVVPFTSLLGGNLYRRVHWLRRSLVVVTVLAGYAVYRALGSGTRLGDLGLASCLAVCQMIPGLVGVLFWPRATARGAAVGLTVGILAWIAAPVLPMLSAAGRLPAEFDWLSPLGLADDSWSFTAAFTLGANALAFVVGSLSREPTHDERQASAICRGASELLTDEVVDAGSVDEFEARLAPVIGATAANREVNRALSELRLLRDARHPEALQRLRTRLVTNLSELIGPFTALLIMDEHLAVVAPSRELLSAQLLHIERRLSSLRLEGPTAELARARAFLHGLLEELPSGVCALGAAGDIALWNRVMVRITGVEASDARGRTFPELTEPWSAIFAAFAAGAETEREVRLDLGACPMILSLRRSSIRSLADQSGLVMLVEDRTFERTLQAKVERQNRLELIGRLAAGAAHEIKNPLTGISLLAQGLKDDRAGTSAREKLDLLLGEVRCIDRIVGDLLGFARAEDVRIEASVSQLVEHSVTRACLGRPYRSAEVQCCIDPELTVVGNPHRLEQMVVNLLTNAIDASTAGEAVQVEATRSEAKLFLRVVDRGGGMSPEVLARAFEPFFTTKPPGNGSGLGLWLAHDIAMDHGGSICIDSTLGQGTSITVELPA
jgi:signal transduction histidine kinase/Na+/proline symporter